MYCGHDDVIDVLLDHVAHADMFVSAERPAYDEKEARYDDDAGHVVYGDVIEEEEDEPTDTDDACYTNTLHQVEPSAERKRRRHPSKKSARCSIL